MQAYLGKGYCKGELCSGVLWDPFHKTAGEMRGAGPFLTFAFAGPEVETADEGPSLLPPLAHPAL